MLCTAAKQCGPAAAPSVRMCQTACVDRNDEFMKTSVSLATLYVLGWLSVLSAAAPVKSNGRVNLATFDGAKGSTFTWSAVNDPVMGGQSTG